MVAAMDSQNKIETPENELATIEAKITKFEAEIAPSEADSATARAKVKQSWNRLDAFKNPYSASNERELHMHLTDVESAQEMVEITQKQPAYLVTEMTSLSNKMAALNSVTCALIKNTKSKHFVSDALSTTNSKAIFTFQFQSPSTKMQKDRPGIFRWKVAGYYKRRTAFPGRYRCQVSDEVGNGRVVAAHRLLDHSSTYDAHLKEHFEIDDINSFRNTLLLAKGIKKAYKEGRACFVAGDDDETFHLQIWDDKIRNEPIFKGSNRTIGDCDGNKLSLPPRVEPPYKQVLSYHAQVSYKHALRMEWISSNDKVPNIYYSSPLKDSMLFIVSSPKSTTSEITTNSANQ